MALCRLRRLGRHKKELKKRVALRFLDPMRRKILECGGSSLFGVGGWEATGVSIQGAGVSGCAADCYSFRLHDSGRFRV